MAHNRRLQSHGFADAVESCRLVRHPDAGVDGALGTALPVEAVVGDLEPFSFSEEEYGVSFRKGSDLTEEINSFMIKLRDEGTLRDLAAKYNLTLAN